MFVQKLFDEIHKVVRGKLTKQIDGSTIIGAESIGDSSNAFGAFLIELCFLTRRVLVSFRIDFIHNGRNQILGFASSLVPILCLVIFPLFHVSFLLLLQLDLFQPVRSLVSDGELGLSFGNFERHRSVIYRFTRCRLDILPLNPKKTWWCFFLSAGLWVPK